MSGKRGKAMSNAEKTPKELHAEIDELRYRLEEAEETLRAIGSGEVDAFVVSGPDGNQIFSLKGAEQPYRALVETMNEGAATLSTDGIILYCNNRLADLLQLPMERLVGTEFSAYVKTADQHLFTALLKTCRVKNATDEIVLSTATGGVVPVIFSCCAHEFGENKGISAVVTDLSQQKRNEEMLASERLANLIIEQAGEVIIVCDDQGIIIRTSQLAYTLLGVNLLLKQFDEMLQLNIYEPKSLFSIMTPLSGVCLAGVEVEFKRSDNQKYHLLLNAAPLKNYQSQIIGCVITLTDITERKLAEEEKLRFEYQLQHTQKLESLGVLSGGIAHDFNNILAIIMGYCSLTKMDYETAENNIVEIEKAAERAAGLCRQMLAYAGKAQLTMSQINMRSLVDEMVKMLKATLPQNAVIKPELSTYIPFISADASQLRQVVMNLIINASEAIGKEHGKINISLSRTTIIGGQSDTDYNGKAISPGGYVCLEVTDNGCGMDEETKRRIFEPFYTTKFTGRGLGMSAVLGIIKSHGGALQLSSRPGQGTTFKVYLSVQNIDSGNEENTCAPVPLSQWKGSGTILLVEDEDQVRYIAKAILQKIGFSVLEAVNGKEALELYQRNANDIALVMTDMGMPIMDGYELFHELRKRNPELPIIVSSGYGDAEIGSRIGAENIAGIISKPYGPDQLREVLKKALEGCGE
jgi:PAS domain S-box-containing protein